MERRRRSTRVVDAPSARESFHFKSVALLRQLPVGVFFAMHVDVGKRPFGIALNKPSSRFVEKHALRSER